MYSMNRWRPLFEDMNRRSAQLEPKRLLNRLLGVPMGFQCHVPGVLSGHKTQRLRSPGAATGSPSSCSTLARTPSPATRCTRWRTTTAPLRVQDSGHGLSGGQGLAPVDQNRPVERKWSTGRISRRGGLVLPPHADDRLLDSDGRLQKPGMQYGPKKISASRQSRWPSPSITARPRTPHAKWGVPASRAQRRPPRPQAADGQGHRRGWLRGWASRLRLPLSSGTRAS